MVIWIRKNKLTNFGGIEMTKHETLTEEEFKAYKPPKRAVAQLNDFMVSRNCTESEIKILDWGCGRGRFVLWLREQGFKAYGVDVDMEPIQNGLVLFKAKGYTDDTLSLIDAAGRTCYMDGFFDFVMSDNVFEHVSDLKIVINEMERITSETGGGYHIFPAQRQFIEGHLFMPFVHWIPKGSFRKAIIRLFVRFSREPKWKELDGCMLDEKVDAYYKYSTDHIFYRPFSSIKRLFEQNGFNVSFLTIQNPAVTRNKLLGPLSRNPLLKPIINWMLLTFKQVEVLLKK
jgi:SAM-dependent methyltransferase